MIKLIASDLDGTIMDNNHILPKDNIEAINNLHKKNILFVICTGKTYSISKDICNKLHANFGIFGNGSQIIDLSTGSELARKTLTIDEIERVCPIIQKYNLHVHAYTENSIITPKPLYMDLRNFILFPNKIKLEIVDSVISHIQSQNQNIFKLIISSPFHLEKVKEDLEKITNLSITHISKTGLYKDNVIDKEYEYLDISPLHVSKGNALKILSNYLQIEKKDILSIGDNINDIDMFKVSNITAAVGDAHEQVKKIANYITINSAEKAGFAEAIYKFIPF